MVVMIYNLSPVLLAGHYLGYVECFQDPLKTFLMKAKLVTHVHYLQSKYCLNASWS